VSGIFLAISRKRTNHHYKGKSITDHKHRKYLGPQRLITRRLKVNNKATVALHLLLDICQYIPRCGGLSTAPGLRGAEGPGVVLPELVGVLDFGTGVAAFSLCK
jgi:hypothetical protein